MEPIVIAGMARTPMVGALSRVGLLCPAMRPPNGRAALVRGLGQPIVAGIAVDLEDAVEASQEDFGIFARAAESVEVDHATRVLDAPRPVVTGKCPEISGHCRSSPRVQYRSGGSVHEQLGRPLQMLGQPVNDGLQMERGLADPILSTPE